MAVLKYRATDGSIKTLPLSGGGGSGDVPQDLVDTVNQHTQDIAGLETQTTQLTTAVGAINDSLVTKYSSINPPPYPVISVNGQTGAVNIEAGNAPILENIQCNYDSSIGAYNYTGSLAINKIAFARVYNGPSGYPTNSIVTIRIVSGRVKFFVWAISVDLSGGSAVYNLTPEDSSYLNFYVGGFA